MPPRRREDAAAPGGFPSTGHWSLVEGLYAAGLFNEFIRRCDHVTMAAQTMICNVGGFIETSDTDAFGTPKYVAFKLYVDHSGPLAVRTSVESPTFAVPAMGNMPARRDEPYLDVTATRDQDGRRLWLHVANRHPRQALEAEIELGHAVPGAAIAHTMTGPDVWAWNSFGNKEAVKITSSPVSFGRTFTFPARSATALEITLAENPSASTIGRP